MADKQYRAAVIGSTGRGDYGHDVDQAFGGFENVEVVAVADDSPQGLAAKAAQHGVSQAFGDYRQMLNEVKPDIVAICQRWIDRHFEMAMAAAERGIHIYMEKPLCRTLAEADKLIDTCERTHARLALAHWTRYSPKLDRVKRLLEAGRLGKVLEYRGRGKEDARGGGEDLWVLGTHIMDMIRFLGGHPTWCYATVEIDGKPVTAADVVPGAEGIGPLAGSAVHAMYGMPDGSKAYFASVAGTAGNPTRFALQVFGSHGIVELLEGTMTDVFALRDRGWSPPRSKKEWVGVSSLGFEEEEPLTDPRLAQRHFLAIEDLLAAIEEQRDPKSSVYEARGALEMIVAVFESHRQGKPVPLPLENRENPLAML